LITPDYLLFYASQPFANQLQAFFYAAYALFYPAYAFFFAASADIRQAPDAFAKAFLAKT